MPRRGEIFGLAFSIQGSFLPGWGCSSPNHQRQQRVVDRPQAKVPRRAAKAIK
jgi:hypothetical protein